MKTLTAKFLGWGGIFAVVFLFRVGHSEAQIVEEPIVETGVLCCEYTCPAQAVAFKRGGHQTFIAVLFGERDLDPQCPQPTTDELVEEIRGCQLRRTTIVNTPEECGRNNAEEHLIHNP